MSPAITFEEPIAPKKIANYQWIVGYFRPRWGYNGCLMDMVSAGHMLDMRGLVR
jgi:hypothetical protein